MNVAGSSDHCLLDVVMTFPQRLPIPCYPLAVQPPHNRQELGCDRLDQLLLPTSPSNLSHVFEKPSHYSSISCIISLERTHHVTPETCLADIDPVISRSDYLRTPAGANLTITQAQWATEP